MDRLSGSVLEMIRSSQRASVRVCSDTELSFATRVLTVFRFASKSISESSSQLSVLVQSGYLSPIANWFFISQLSLSSLLNLGSFHSRSLNL